MPDLTPIVVATCESNTNWTKVVNGREVHYGKTGDGSRNPFVYGYSCECPGFQYRRTCKHIAEAKEIRCGWNAELSESDAKVCPQCGGPVAWVQVMV